jgi:hypothetical protein
MACATKLQEMNDFYLGCLTFTRLHAYCMSHKGQNEKCCDKKCFITLYKVSQVFMKSILLNFFCVPEGSDEVELELQDTEKRLIFVTYCINCM